ncbi:LuxR C-terminal-related transcriptional regulator [Nonomuraea sp. NBC_00507]|uniref:LuxR C-terminal-related transcriptional regulator n=1 Tax=Nonomuraea sp. NBC_00507 TaxID=2976002 RepID=UPI002E18EC48
MPTTVLATKVFAPARRPQLVARPRLIDRLDAALDPGRRLTLISAPAGFGKTTLVTDWIEHTTRRQLAARVAWLSLDDGDNDLPRLLTHLVAALQGLEEDLGYEALGLLHGTLALPVEASLTALINDVAQTAGQIVLVLDDYHVIDARPVHEAMTFLLDHLPPQLHLVIASRSDPPLPLSRLRTRDELVELRAADLRFTPDEAMSFLNQVMGLGLSTSDVDALETRTEGWIAGLQLVALSLRGHVDVSGFIGAFTGSHRFVLDYLVDEVLRHQPSHVRAFLLHTAVLDRLAAPLCDAVTVRTDSAAMLENLDGGNLFVVALDDQREWSRYHHLFADMLRARLRSEEPELIPVLHRRASDWYERHDLAEDAVRHALAARDFDHAAHLMELALPALRRNRQDAMLLGWLAALPDDVVRRSAVLSVFYGWRLMVSGDLDAVEDRLDDAERALAAGSTPDAGNEELRTLPVTLAIYRASLAQARGDAAGTAQHAQRALEMAGPGAHLSRGAAAGFLGLAAWANGEIEPGLRTFSEAVRSLRAAGNLADALSGTIVLADMWLAAGRPERARGLYEAALREATAHGDTHGTALPLPTADLHVGLSELDRELGNLAGATQHLETAKALGERAEMTENRHRWFLAMARIREADGDPDGAISLLDQAERLYVRGFFPDVRPIAAMRARIRIIQGKLSEAADWARERGLPAMDDLSYLREFDHLTVVRLLIAQHRSHPDAGTIREAVGLLGLLHEAATQAARPGSLLEIAMLQALAHQAQGDLARALDALERALGQTPEPGGYGRLLLDEGEPMVSLLHAADERGRLGDHARRMLRARTPSEDASDQVTPPSAVGLSERELQVLRLLNSTLSGPEIARELFISLNTFRSHTKHIFTKLDVNSRPAAVSRARERGLL